MRSITMKHTKIFFALLVLAAAVLAFGCKQANTGFTMNENQTKAYNSMIIAFEAAASLMDQGFSMKEKYSKVMLWWKGYYLNK